MPSKLHLSLPLWTTKFPSIYFKISTPTTQKLPPESPPLLRISLFLLLDFIYEMESFCASLSSYGDHLLLIWMFFQRVSKFHILNKDATTRTVYTSVVYIPIPVRIKVALFHCGCLFGRCCSTMLCNSGAFSPVWC